MAETKIVDPDFALKKKTGNANIEKIISPAKIKQAEKVVEKEKTNLKDDVYKDVLKLEQMFNEIKGRKDQRERLEEMGDIALNVKSGAAMAGYVLATELAKSFYQLLMFIDHINSNDEKIIQAQLNSLKLVFASDKTGITGPTDQELVEMLNAYVKQRKST